MSPPFRLIRLLPQQLFVLLPLLAFLIVAEQQDQELVLDQDKEHLGDHGQLLLDRGKVRLKKPPLEVCAKIKDAKNVVKYELCMNGKISECDGKNPPLCVVDHGKMICAVYGGGLDAYAACTDKKDGKACKKLYGGEELCVETEMTKPPLEVGRVCAKRMDPRRKDDKNSQFCTDGKINDCNPNLRLCVYPHSTGGKLCAAYHPVDHGLVEDIVCTDKKEGSECMKKDDGSELCVETETKTKRARREAKMEMMKKNDENEGDKGKALKIIKDGVYELTKNGDKNGDGKLTKEEVISLWKKAAENDEQKKKFEGVEHESPGKGMTGGN